VKFVSNILLRDQRPTKILRQERQEGLFDHNIVFNNVASVCSPIQTIDYIISIVSKYYDRAKVKRI
jgi:hypothetical protein